MDTQRKRLVAIAGTVGVVLVLVVAAALFAALAGFGYRGWASAAWLAGGIVVLYIALRLIRDLSRRA